MDELQLWQDLARGLKRGLTVPKERKPRMPVQKTISSKRYELIVEFHNSHKRTVKLKSLDRDYGLLHQLRKTAEATARKIVEEREDVEYVSVWELHRTLIGRFTQDADMVLAPVGFVKEVAA